MVNICHGSPVEGVVRDLTTHVNDDDCNSRLHVTRRFPEIPENLYILPVFAGKPENDENLKYSRITALVSTGNFPEIPPMLRASLEYHVGTHDPLIVLSRYLPAINNCTHDCTIVSHVQSA